jgi:hypothetical protein
MTAPGTIGDLERRAGVTDREAFWARFSHIPGAQIRDGKLESLAFRQGVAELRRMVAAREVTA